MLISAAFAILKIQCMRALRIDDLCVQVLRSQLETELRWVPIPVVVKLDMSLKSIEPNMIAVITVIFVYM